MASAPAIDEEDLHKTVFAIQGEDILIDQLTKDHKVYIYIYLYNMYSSTLCKLWDRFKGKVALLSETFSLQALFTPAQKARYDEIMAYLSEHYA